MATSIPRTKYLLKPMCAVCNKPVEHIEKYRDELFARDRWMVRCHGKEEVSDLTDELVQDTTNIEIDVAFTKEKLENDKNL